MVWPLLIKVAANYILLLQTWFGVYEKPKLWFGLHDFIGKCYVTLWSSFLMAMVTWIFWWLLILFSRCVPATLASLIYGLVVVTINMQYIPFMIIMELMVLIREFCSVDSMKTKWIHTVVISSLIVWTYSLHFNV